MSIIKTQKGVSAVLPYMDNIGCTPLRGYDVEGKLQGSVTKYVLLLTYHCVRIPPSMIMHPRDLQHYTHGCTWSLCPYLTNAPGDAQALPF